MTGIVRVPYYLYDLHRYWATLKILIESRIKSDQNLYFYIIHSNIDCNVLYIFLRISFYSCSSCSIHYTKLSSFCWSYFLKSNRISKDKHQLICIWEPWRITVHVWAHLFFVFFRLFCCHEDRLQGYFSRSPRSRQIAKRVRL